MTRQCIAKANSTGRQCRVAPMIGLSVCWRHGGASPRAQRKHLVAKSLKRWQLGDATDDPTETLLKLITQTRQRCDYYADLLQQQVESAEGSEDTATGLKVPAWVAGLIGMRYAAAGKDGALYATDEGVRALVQLEQSERRLLTEQSKAAIAAGLTERVVAIAEQQGAMLVAAVRAMVLAAMDAGMPEVWADAIYSAAPGALRAVGQQGGQP